MHKILIHFYLILLSVSVFSQQVDVKKVGGMQEAKFNDYYTFVYNKSSGSYIYLDIDTNSNKSTVYTKDGKAGVFDIVNNWSAVFDKNGNVYYTAGNLKDDSTYTYYLLKNDDILGTYAGINDGWEIRNDKLYFAYQKDNNYYFAVMDMNTNSIETGKPYDYINFVYYPSSAYSEEQSGIVGFTKDGHPFYVAEKSDSKFFVIGGKEMKAYSDIDLSSVKTDNNGVLTYVARDAGKLYESRGNTFVVQGDKEYKKKKYDYIYGIQGFTASNLPVYIAADSLNENTFPQRIVIGEREEKSFTGGVWNVQILPSGALSYIGGDLIDAENYKVRSRLVMDGKAGKKYYSIDNVYFSDKMQPVYAAQKKDNKYILVMPDGRELDNGYDYIYSITMSKNGTVAYLGQNNGDYEKKIPDKVFVHIGDAVAGPFNYVPTIDVKANTSIKFDDRNNYLYVAQNMLDPEKYIFDAKAVWNGGESEKFDAVTDAGIMNGKPYYMGMKSIDRDAYISNYALYYNGQKLTDDYNFYTDFAEDGNSVSFVAGKDKEFYFVRVNF